MNNRNRLCLIIIIVTVFLSATLLSGCQLAVETDAAVGKGDKLCGMFVTLERTDEQGNVILTESGTEAVPSDASPLSFGPYGIEGTPSEDGYSLKFNGVDGYYFGNVHYYDGDQRTSVADRGFYDSKMSVNETNEGKTTIHEVTLYLSTKFLGIANSNPVYVRPDGTYYCLKGDGAMIGNLGENAPSSYTLDNSYTTTIGGITNTEKETFKVNFISKDKTKQLFIKEMNKDDELIKTTEYFADSPEVFIADENTKYLIVEELKESSNGKVGTKRSIYSFTEEAADQSILFHNSSFSNETGVIGLMSIEFEKN